MAKITSAVARARGRRQTTRFLNTLAITTRYAESAQRAVCPVCGSAGLLRTELKGISLSPEKVNALYVCRDCALGGRITVVKG